MKLKPSLFYLTPNVLFRNSKLIVDLGRKARSKAAVEPLRNVIVENLVDQVGLVSKVGSMMGIEVVDLGAISSAVKVFLTIRVALDRGPYERAPQHCRCRNR